MLSWGKIALWCLLVAGVWGQLENTNEARLKVAILACRAALLHWYAEQQSHGIIHTRIDFITSKMIGSVQDPCLKLKAMEAYGFLQFLLHCLAKYSTLVPKASVLMAAGQAIHSMVQVMKQSPASLPMQTQQELLDLWKRHMSLMTEFDIFTPKHHLMFHMILRASVLGNPWMYNTFLDESLNKQLKAVCRLCHQVTFESIAILKITEVLKRQAAKRGLV